MIPVIQEMPPVLWEYAQDILSYKPLKFTKTYWGHEVLLEENPQRIWKEIFMEPNTQSSMEFHLTKEETYYLIRGSLNVGIRTDRAINSTLSMIPGTSLDIPPGLMHMRMAGPTGAVILEKATHDDKLDTRIVHNGHLYTHVDGPADRI